MPVEAIFADDELPEDQQLPDIAVELAESWPNISEKKEALPEAETWNGKPNKIELLIK